MLSPPNSPEPTTTNPVSDFLKSISSYDGNVMLAAVISLLLVILFVLLLHIYARWFLAQARQRRQASISVSHALRHTSFHNFNSLTLDTTLSSTPLKGLDASVISSIPLFVYKAEDPKMGLECVICLSTFEENDVGRNLLKCGHTFHVECIDMWLQSHSNCPICRAPAVGDSDKVSNVYDDVNSLESGGGDGESLDLVSSELVGVSDGESRLEIVSDIVSNCESEDVVVNDFLSASSSSSSTLSSSLGSSLKRMLSRNRSERKVFPSANVGQLEV